MTIRKPNVLSGLLLTTVSVGLTACGLGADSIFAGKAGVEVFEGPVPRAVCGPGSILEEGLQGQAPTSEPGYRCNMEVVGHEGSPGGASWQMAWYDDCAYYNRDFPSNPQVITSADPGVVVVDASDPANPVRTTSLTSAAMLDPHESLKVNERRALLGAVAGWDAGGAGPVFFDVYDVSGDCAHPQLKASVPVNIPIGHEGGWAPDGLTYYGTATWSDHTTAIDVTNPSQPTTLTVLDQRSHGLSASEDGTRAYFARIGNVGAAHFNLVFPGPNGLVIRDVSQIQSRVPNPQAPVLGEVFWTDGGAAQSTIPVTIKGQPYVIIFDERVAGAARIIDISDEANPFVISKLKLEIHMMQNIEPGVEYNAHYCSVDRLDEPTVLGCTYRADGGPSSGTRVFDIRDPYRPREIAYINPVGADTTSQVRFVRERSEIWFTDQSSGFYVVRMTNGVWPFED